MKGRVHSIETLGLLDGPGIRMLIFLQGCPLRCQYCHNPDSQDPHAGTVMSTDELIARAMRLLPYFRRSGGGVTATGGEPLMQPEFLIELFEGLQAEDICTVLDTSGIGKPPTYDAILERTDLVILDLKHYDPATHLELVGVPLDAQTPFIEALKRHESRLWLRHVMVPGFTDTSESMEALAERIRPLMTVCRVENIEILPYQTFGVDKYEALGRNYELAGVPPMDSKRAKELEAQLIDLIDFIPDTD